MQKLEQQCWRYLMTILDPETNCEVLHELADRYDCPPLKLAAWRVLQETIPGYSVSPDKFIQPKRLRKLSDTVVKKGFDHGFTGPGDAAYSSNSINGLHIKHGQSAIQSDDEDASVAADMPSLFDNKTRSRSSYRARPAEDGTQSLAEALEESELQEGEEDESTGDIPENYTRPEELSADASASEVVQAWSYRLREVYNACMSYDGDQYQDRESFHLANKPNTRILKYPRHPGKGREEKDSQNGSVQNFDEGEEDNLIRTRPPITSATRPKSMSPMKGKGHQQIGIEKLIDWREELKRFYVSINMAEKIASISTILQQWEGKEEQMLSSLAEKYKNQIPSHMMMHINQLIGILESQTESSFINQVR